MEILSLESSPATRERWTTDRSDRTRASHFEIVGATGAPVVVVLGGISATRHVTTTDHDPSPGWWDDIVGRGRGIDTAEYRVLGVDFLDGGWRSDGRPQRIVTTHDQAANVARVLDELGVEHPVARESRRKLASALY